MTLAACSTPCHALHLSKSETSHVVVASNVGVDELLAEEEADGMFYGLFAEAW